MPGFMRAVCRFVLGGSIAFSILMKIKDGMLPGLPGGIGHAIVIYELGIIGAIIAGWDRTASIMAVFLFLGGCAYALVIETPCNCLGSIALSRADHLIVAGSLGLVALGFSWLAFQARGVFES